MAFWFFFIVELKSQVVWADTESALRISERSGCAEERKKCGGNLELTFHNGA
jgi:hypothetical protein